MLIKNIFLKLNNFIKIIFFIILITVLIFLVMEIAARKKFNSYTKGSCSTIKISKESSLKIPEGNCEILVKHWENKKEIIYKTDKKGNRESTLPVDLNNNLISIAFFGDSFTWGDMNSADENYTHYAVSELNNIKAGYTNFGVPGYNLAQVLERMKITDLKKYNYIIYGLTPNDLFSPQSISINKEKKIETFNEIKKKNSIDIIKEKIRKHSIRSIKVAGKIFFDIFPEIYISLYTARDPNLAGYLSVNSSSYWNKRYQEFFDILNNLDSSIKKKLIIQLIPQRVQVLLYKKGDLARSLAFENRIVLMCEKLDIKCNHSQLTELSNLEQSHFTIDGHFTPSANKVLGKGLSRFVSNVINVN